jgi:hypothetical protein
LQPALLDQDFLRLGLMAHGAQNFGELLIRLGLEIDGAVRMMLFFKPFTPPLSIATSQVTSESLISCAIKNQRGRMLPAFLIRD